jgi:hypothetical protein
MSQLDLRKKETNPDRIYYDITITNVKSETTIPPTIYYNESRQNPYCPNSGDYYLSIIRFQLDTQTLPIFIPEIQQNQSDPDLTIYSVTLQYKNVAKRVYIKWIPQYSTEPVPPPPNSTLNGLQVESAYYYMFNYSYFTTLVLFALQDAFTQLQADPATAGDLALAHAPVISWDAMMNTAVISAESAYYNQTTTSPPNPLNPVAIYFNSPLFNLFSSFVGRYEGIDYANLGRNVRINIAEFAGTNTILLPVSAPPADQYQATQVAQEYSTIQSWTPVSSIVFTSNTLPIVSNQLSAPLVFNESKNVDSLNGNNANFAQIITDLASGDQDYKPFLLYNPTAEFRYIDMYGNQPLTNIDISVFWKNKLGVLIPFRLASGGSCSIKILFAKKSTISQG